MKLAFSNLCALLTFSSLALETMALEERRHSTPRFRGKDSFANLNMKGSLRTVVQPLDDTPIIMDDSDHDEDIDLINLMTMDMSMPTSEPSFAPSFEPSVNPSYDPSTIPSHQPTKRPSASPSLGPTTFTPAPTVSTQPSVSPSVSQAPSSSLPVPTELPSSKPSWTPTEDPSAGPSSKPSWTPTEDPSAGPSSKPSWTPTEDPSAGPSTAPSNPPSGGPKFDNQPAPTVEGCGISADVREEQILALLDSFADPLLIRNTTLPQGKATQWLLENDGRKVCPDATKILQRWVLAVVYFSTGGESWFQCSSSISAVDNCGFQEPFMNKQRFLSSFNECDWAGIVCNNLDCVTEIEFELNNLAGFIPSEIGLLTHLERWGMERGELKGTIPREIENLSNLIFLDLDYNELTGSLTTQLLSLSKLEQLDLNNNKLSGPINGIGVFPDMVFLQLHDNEFTGTVPAAVGTFLKLQTFTLHETHISGTMPTAVCDLRTDDLDSLIADCDGNTPDIVCSEQNCCTDCRRD